MGIFDMPAMIDYVLAQTGQKQLFYIGFSQGTTQFWVLMSLKPQYNEKIKLMSALAPVAYVGHLDGLLRPLSVFANFVKVRIV
jgi:pimeloyl-ACP methyl ester carboxylesterase